MAALTNPLPSALTSLLSTLLPCGFAVGPSKFCEGRLGLWWVGCLQKPGSLLGRDGDTWSTSVHQSKMMMVDATVNTDSRTYQNICKEENELVQVAANKEALQHTWISFACLVQSREQQNVLVQCGCREDESVHLRVCQDIHPGTELLLCEDSVGKLQPAVTAALDKNAGYAGMMEPINEEQSKVTEMSTEKNIPEKKAEDKDLDRKQRKGSMGSQVRMHTKQSSSRKHPERGSQRTSGTAKGHVDSRGDQRDRTGDGKGVCTIKTGDLTGNGGHTDSGGGHTDSGGGHTDSFHQDSRGDARVRQVCRVVPAVRCSSRLAAKPRRHWVKGHMNPDPVRQTAGRRRISPQTATAPSGAAVAVTPDGAAGAKKRSQVRERRHSCSICGKKFLQIGHLKKHQFSHTKEKPFSCSECGKKYTSTESFRAHQMSHRGERPFSCPQCEKSYGLKRDLKEHMVVHTGEKPYVCSHCGKGFARRPSLRIHCLLYCSKLTYTPPPKIQCTLCPKLLANSGSLRNHMKLHRGEKPHVCQHCGKRFSQKGNLDSHLRTHNGEKPFSCSECEQRFSQKPELKRHMFSHTGGGFLCIYCGKSLRDPHSLQAHERLHTGDRPHGCPVCGKGYTLATKLRRHMKSSHMTEKPFRCHCGATYSIKQSLLRHQAQHRSEGGAQEEATAVVSEGGAGHPQPIKGRPKKKPRPQWEGASQAGRGKRKRRRVKAGASVEEKNTAGGRERGEDASEGRIQHALVYVRTGDLSVPSPDPPLLLCPQRPLPAGAGQELVEVVISGGQEQCIMVHGQHPVGDLLILQEDESGLCSVAQTVEINTV